jgi:hypothetical protein
MDEVKCPHGLVIDQLENDKEAYTYCAGCLHDALYDGSLGIDMGLHPSILKKMKNKERAKRKKGTAYG